MRGYLQALELYRPKPGRKPRPENVSARIAAIDAQLATAEPARKVRLIQERLDRYSQLKSLEAAADLASLEDDFVRVAGRYSKRKGITYEAWREVGIKPRVLRRAGLQDLRS